MLQHVCRSMVGKGVCLIALCIFRAEGRRFALSAPLCSCKLRVPSPRPTRAFVPARGSQVKIFGASARSVPSPDLTLGTAWPEQQESQRNDKGISSTKLIAEVYYVITCQDSMIRPPLDPNPMSINARIHAYTYIYVNVYIIYTYIYILCIYLSMYIHISTIDTYNLNVNMSKHTRKV